MRNWTFWDWVGFSCIWLGALALAADGAIRNSPELAKVMPQFFTGPIWPFLPLLFVVLGTVVLVARGFGLFGNRREAAPSTIPDLIAPATISKPRDKIRVAGKQERMFVGAGVTPEYLAKFFQDHTAIQAANLIEAFIGKWMKLSGRLNDVRLHRDSFASVSLRRSAVEEDVRACNVTMFFYQPWFDRLAILKRGEELTVIGRIDKVDALSLILEECEIVGVDAQ